MTYRHVIGLGVAGNFAGHLEQAGEDRDFLAVEVKEAIQPKAIFPFYLPSGCKSFLSTYPLSINTINAPEHADNLQIEPEVALLCDIEYHDGKVSNLVPRQFGAYNDCSIRKPGARKISEKKNWGRNTKGLSETLFDIDHFGAGGVLDKFRIACFHIRDGHCHTYGEDSPVVGYSYFHQKLTDWIVDRMNNQEDVGPAEPISIYLKDAKYPEQALISIGATRYTPYGETHFLQPDDISIVVVYDSTLYTSGQIAAMAAERELDEEGISALIQRVV